MNTRKTLAARLSVVMLAGLLAACGAETPKEADVDYRQQFVGEWKSADTNAETHTYIKRTGDTFYIHEGQQDIVGTYDEATKSVLIDNGEKKVPVAYVPETDQLLITGGSKTARFARVK